MKTLVINWAAGEYDIIDHDDDIPAGYSKYGTYENLEAAQKKVQQIKEDTAVWAVFVNEPAGEVFVSRENLLSENWRGSKYSPFRCAGEYSTEKEAREAEAQWEERFATARKEREEREAWIRSVNGWSY